MTCKFAFLRKRRSSLFSFAAQMSSIMLFDPYIRWIIHRYHLVFFKAARIWGHAKTLVLGQIFRNWVYFKLGHDLVWTSIFLFLDWYFFSRNGDREGGLLLLLFLVGDVFVHESVFLHCYQHPLNFLLFTLNRGYDDIQLGNSRTFVFLRFHYFIFDGLYLFFFSNR